MTSTENNSAVEETTVDIIIDGKLTTFDYDDLKSFHKGDSWFGCTVGFRVMQLAARELSQPSPWSREHLAIVSGHPGPGVKDAIELVTATISSGNFQLHENVENNGSSSGCNSSMRFEWWITSNNETVHVKLHDNIVPESFLQLLDRLNADEYHSDNEKQQDRNKFDQMKQDLSKLLWNQSLYASFDINHVTSTTNSEGQKRC